MEALCPDFSALWILTSHEFIKSISIKMSELGNSKPGVRDSLVLSATVTVLQVVKIITSCFKARASNLGPTGQGWLSKAFQVALKHSALEKFCRKSKNIFDFAKFSELQKFHLQLNIVICSNFYVVSSSRGWQSI